MSKIEIEIPAGKEVDWKASATQKKIVLKDKQLTYEDICKELFKNGHYFIDTTSEIQKVSFTACDANTATSEHQLECILAKNMLANVAIYLNGEWKPSKTNEGHFDAYVLFATPNKDYIGEIKISNCAQNSNVLFKSRETAQQAVEILGKEVVFMALEPLY